MTERFAFPAGELRRRTVRGVAINALFLVLIDAVVLAQGLIVTRLLGPRAIGLYGIVSITVISLMTLKRVGIDEAFVQQQEEEQEEEFQRAFTLELVLGSVFALIVCIAAPILAVVYHHPRLLPLTLATAYLPLAIALQAPAWIFLRRMEFVRQRTMQAIVPIVTCMVALPLAATGFGVWSLVVGGAAGNLAGVIAAIAMSPYRLRMRFDRTTTRRYLAFSGPVFVATACWMAVSQGQVFAFDLHAGLAGAGFITLAVTLTRYVDRADLTITATIYPAICAIQGQTRRLAEMFDKASRGTMMWVLPFGAATVLFAPDIVRFLLGNKWIPAITLLQGLGVAAALSQVGFSWFAFYRAHGDTRPTAVEAASGLAGFLLLAIPGLALWGTAGFVWGRIAGVLVMLAVRAYYVRRLLPGMRLWRITLLSARPMALAAVLTVAVRLAMWGGHRSAAQAAVEAALFVVVYLVATFTLERPLIAELRQAWGGGAATALAPQPAPGEAP